MLYQVTTTITMPKDFFFSLSLPSFNGLKPLIDLIGGLATFAMKHPLMSLLAAGLILFCLSGLVQAIIETSKKMWNYIFASFGKGIKYLGKSAIAAFRRDSKDPS